MSTLKLKKYLFALLAFVVPLLVRFIPEVLMGGYLVGFDTVAHYVPTTLNWLSGEVTLESFIATAPILYMFTTALTYLCGSLFWVLKVLPSVLLGFLGLSIYGYARQGLGWSSIKSLVPALVGTLYFVGLRVSWDAFREVFGLIFLFVALLFVMRLEGGFSWRRGVVFCLALCGVVLSNQVVAVLALGIVLFTLLNKLLRGNRGLGVWLVGLCVPAVVLFFATYFLSPTVSDYRLIFGFPSDPDGWLALFGYGSYLEMLGSEAVFVLFCFLPLLPLAVLGARRFRDFHMWVWVVLLAAVAFIPLVSPSGLRLIMLLVYPLAFFAVDGLSVLRRVCWVRRRRLLFGVGLAFLVGVTVVPSLGFMASPAEAPFGYFAAGGLNSHIYQVPSSMLQNTVALSDCEATEEVVSWLADNMEDDAVLLSHRAFYGWVLPKLDAERIVMYEYDDPAEVAFDVAQDGYSEIYLVWWVEGAGWYGVPSVPEEFEAVYSVGRMAVYTYLDN